MESFPLGQEVIVTHSPSGSPPLGSVWEIVTEAFVVGTVTQVGSVFGVGNVIEISADHPRYNGMRAQGISVDSRQGNHVWIAAHPVEWMRPNEDPDPQSHDILADLGFTRRPSVLQDNLADLLYENGHMDDA